MEHLSGTLEQCRNSAKSWNHSSEQFFLSLQTNLGTYMIVVVSWTLGKQTLLLLTKMQYSSVLPFPLFNSDACMYLPQLLNTPTSCLQTSFLHIFPHKTSNLVIWIPEVLWMSGNFAALFTGKGLPDNLKEDDSGFSLSLPV